MPIQAPNWSFCLQLKLSFYSSWEELGWGTRVTQSRWTVLVRINIWYQIWQFFTLLSINYNNVGAHSRARQVVTVHRNICLAFTLLHSVIIGVNESNNMGKIKHYIQYQIAYRWRLIFSPSNMIHFDTFYMYLLLRQA